MPDQETMDGVLTAVQRAFGKQAEHYDQEDSANLILNDWRKQVYLHAERFLRPSSHVLELNAGTGIDAIHFAKAGHQVHAIDISPGMIGKIREKINEYHLEKLVTVQQCSFECLHMVREKKFDYVFSNFGGLNCCRDLEVVANHLPQLLNKGAFVTWVVMPPICPWELAGIFKGNKTALRRLKKGGTTAYLQGESFLTYYHSLSSLQQKLGKDFHFRMAEGLGALSPPPSSIRFAMAHPTTVFLLKKLDHALKMRYPFNRWADHIIATFQYYL